MDEYTYIEILIEDQSGGILVEQIMDKYVMDRENTLKSEQNVTNKNEKIINRFAKVLKRDGFIIKKYAGEKGNFCCLR